jgi:hypothetical protein
MYKMKNTFKCSKIYPLLSILLLLALDACNFTGGGAAPVDNNANATATAVFQTLEAQSAEMTAQAGRALQPPAATEQPPVDTQPPTEPSQPITAGEMLTVTIQAKSNTNCRSGPDKGYPKVSNLGADLRATVTGKDSTGAWLYMQNKKSGGFCWVSVDTVNVTGNASALPVVEAMPLDAAQTQAYQTEMARPPSTPVRKVPRPTATPGS